MRFIGFIVLIGFRGFLGLLGFKVQGCTYTVENLADKLSWDRAPPGGHVLDSHTCMQPRLHSEGRHSLCMHP